MNTTKKFSREVRERAVRMVLEQRGEYQVDPELAQIDRLPQPNPGPVVAHAISCHPPGSPLIAHPMLMT